MNSSANRDRFGSAERFGTVLQGARAFAPLVSSASGARARLVGRPQYLAPNCDSCVNTTPGRHAKQRVEVVGPEDNVISELEWDLVLISYEGGGAPNATGCWATESVAILKVN